MALRNLIEGSDQPDAVQESRRYPEQEWGPLIDTRLETSIGMGPLIRKGGRNDIFVNDPCVIHCVSCRRLGRKFTYASEQPYHLRLFCNW